MARECPVGDITPRLSIFYQLFVASRLGGELTEAALQGTGVDGAEYALLSVLFVADGASVGEVARQSGTPVATTSRHLRRLETEGAVISHADGTDGRRMIYELTAEGLRRFRATQVPFTEMYESVERYLGKDAAAVSWALKQLDQAMRVVSGESLELNSEEADESVEVANLEYRGPSLSPSLEGHVLAYIDWIRSRLVRVSA